LNKRYLTSTGKDPSIIAASKSITDKDKTITCHSNTTWFNVLPVEDTYLSLPHCDCGKRDGNFYFWNKYRKFSKSWFKVHKIGILVFF